YVGDGPLHRRGQVDRAAKDLICGPDGQATDMGGGVAQDAGQELGRGGRGGDGQRSAAPVAAAGDAAGGAVPAAAGRVHGRVASRAGGRGGDARAGGGARVPRADG